MPIFAGRMRQPDQRASQRVDHQLVAALLLLPLDVPTVVRNPAILDSITQEVAALTPGDNTT